MDILKINPDIGLIPHGKLKMEPTFKTIDMTQYVVSVSFDHKGKCYKFMGGYSVDGSSGNFDN